MSKQVTVCPQCGRDYTRDPEGLPRQCAEDCPSRTEVTVKPRRRAGSWSTFDRRYDPIDTAEGSVLREWDDPLVQASDERNVWTVVDGDNGECYVSPGFATVNYVGRIVTRHQWSDIEFSNPGYCY